MLDLVEKHAATLTAQFVLVQALSTEQSCCAALTRLLVRCLMRVQGSKATQCTELPSIVEDAGQRVEGAWQYL